MQQQSNPIANPVVVLREEFDDWAILFDPDTGDAYGLNPTGVFVWKLLDGNHSDADIVTALQKKIESLPEEAADHIQEFIMKLVERGLAGYEIGGIGT